MRAKQSQAPERAEGKLLPAGKFLMEVTAEEQQFLELLRVDQLTLDPEAFNHRLLNRGLCFWFFLLRSLSYEGQVLLPTSSFILFASRRPLFSAFSFQFSALLPSSFTQSHRATEPLISDFYPRFAILHLLFSLLFSSLRSPISDL